MRREIFRFVSVGVLSVCAAGVAMARLNINTTAVKNSVVFIYAAGPDGNVDNSKPLGTGFFVSVPTSETPARYYWLLVTARHVFDPQWLNCGLPNPSRVFLRLNKATYDPARDSTGVGFVEVTLASAGRPLFAVNPNGSDVAIVKSNFSNFNPKEYDLDTIPISVFATPDEAKNLSIGDDLLSAGLLPSYTGVKRNYPVFRFGRISDIPDEPLPMVCGQDRPPRRAKMWLIAADLTPGASGSPIFFVPAGANGMTFGGPGRPFLIGLQSASFLGADVAGMTPVQAIFDTIQSMDLPNADLRRGPTSTK